MKKILFSLFIVISLCSFLKAQDIEGSYASGTDKFVFTKSGNHYLFEAFDKNVKYSEGFAYYSSEYNRIIFVFRRTDNQNSGFGNFKVDGNKITGKTLNPDLSERWNGTFTKE